jgi:thiamine-monophosphate kinase
MEREKKIYLENPQIQPDLEGEDYIVGRLLKPEARKDIIEFFASNNITPTSMMDVSDGISSEVLHLCKQSNLGCRVYEEKLPIHDDARRAAFKFGLDPTVCALNGGEDYELIFTLKQEDYDKITLNEEISVIGYMADIEEGCKFLTKGGNTHPITAQGWNAFTK